jgi:hypothetical protein
MQEKAEVNQRVPDSELIALVSNAQEETEGHGGTNKPNLLLHDFVRQLLKKRLWMMDDGADSAGQFEHNRCNQGGNPC